MGFASFEELHCWKLGREIRVDISRLVRTYPKEERYELVSQTRRASRSVTNNIAEGFGRFHFQENIQFCRIARGSLFELIDHLLIANEEEYITNESLSNFKVRIFEGIKVLNGYIKYLEKSKLTSNSITK